jgi:hypothetical protein
VLPANHLKRLLFSFQRPGFNTASVEADSEHNNNHSACQPVFLARLSFFSAVVRYRQMMDGVFT